MEEYQTRPVMSLGQYLENCNRRIYNVDVHFLISTEMADYIIEKTRTTGKNRSETLRDLLHAGIANDRTGNP